MNSKIAIAVLMVASLSLLAWTVQGQTEKRKSVSYEYQVMPDPTVWQGQDQGLKTLNGLGAQGWEITGVVQHGDNPPTLYLKRARQSQ
ncbi:MAG TPA: hypothetical protein VJT15_17165 [Pyrinomonadaceae bacterium]|nr:hypothetical protein [Pyrinomonadaceae bacterium]